MPRLLSRATLSALFAVAAAVSVVISVGSAATTLCVPGELSYTLGPSISGTADVGQTLTANNGTWFSCGMPITGYTYQWFRDGGAIGGATGQTYSVPQADAGHSLFVQVTAHNAENAMSANSNSVSIPPPPSNTSAPVISGTPQPGATLAVSTGTWSGSPSSFSYQWYRSGSAIGGATGNQYALTAADESASVSATVTGSNFRGGSTAGAAGVVVNPSHTYGYRYLTTANVSPLRGSRSMITTPLSSFPLDPASGNDALMAVWAVKAGGTAGIIAIDAGYAASDRPSGGLDGDCNRSINQTLTNYVEQVTAAGSFDCYDGGAMTYNRTLKYSVLKSATGWQGFVDGVAKGPALPLSNMSDADAIEAGGELTSAAVSAKNYGKFGAPGAIKWERHDGTNWIQIASANICNHLDATGSPCSAGNGGWSFTGALPDWTVSHG